MLPLIYSLRISISTYLRKIQLRLIDFSFIFTNFNTIFTEFRSLWHESVPNHWKKCLMMHLKTSDKSQITEVFLAIYLTWWLTNLASCSVRSTVFDGTLLSWHEMSFLAVVDNGDHCLHEIYPKCFSLLSIVACFFISRENHNEPLIKTNLIKTNLYP